MDESALPLGLRVFPNPTIGQLTIQWKEAHKSISITLMDITGRVVDHAQFRNTSEGELTVNGAAGIYFLELRTEAGKVERLKVVKE